MAVEDLQRSSLRARQLRQCSQAAAAVTRPDGPLSPSAEATPRCSDRLPHSVSSRPFGRSSAWSPQHILPASAGPQVPAGRGTFHLCLSVMAGFSLALAAGMAARAQSASPNQPLAIQGLPPAPCPLLVPKSDFGLQPLRIQPSQVARKNAIGCLSPADAAVYGPDGCPVKLCSASQGTVPLPQL